MPLPDHGSVRILKTGTARPKMLVGKCGCGCIFEVPEARAQKDDAGYMYQCPTLHCDQTVMLVTGATADAHRAEAEKHARARRNSG